jgi:hypothetical protein
MSERLKQFYREYLAWVEAGCPHSDIFATNWGLCTCLDGWSGDDDVLHEEQASLFRSAGLSVAYPFNEDMVCYGYEHNKTKNEARISWVREQAA